MATTKLTINYLLKLFLLVGFAMLANVVNASGYEGFGENTFAPEYHVPQADIADFASGKLGVMPSTYWRIYQFRSEERRVGKECA